MATLAERVNGYGALYRAQRAELTDSRREILIVYLVELEPQA